MMLQQDFFLDHTPQRKINRKRQPLFSTMEELILDMPNLQKTIAEIKQLYLADQTPWIIGFSGGKDSTVCVSLVYVALQSIPKSQLTKPIYIVSSDTRVEIPAIIEMMTTTLQTVEAKAKHHDIPMTSHQVSPPAEQSFWTNLIGKGYPAPTRQFRWCTSRMKINPVSQFIKDTVSQHGQVIVVLGSRSAESNARAQSIARHKIKDSYLSKHASLTGALTYMPIETWSADDVWAYLLGAPAPWGGDHFELFDLYKDSNAGECPVVIDTGTPSCGNSRFGCWTCTVVTKDRAIEGLIDSGESWLQELKEFRNELYHSTLPQNKLIYRNTKRRNGKTQYRTVKNKDGSTFEKIIPGPYLMIWRKKWLRQLLILQKKMHDKNVILISNAELAAIQTEWINDNNEPDKLNSVHVIIKETRHESLDG